MCRAEWPPRRAPLRHRQPAHYKTPGLSPPSSPTVFAPHSPIDHRDSHTRFAHATISNPSLDAPRLKAAMEYKPQLPPDRTTAAAASRVRIKPRIIIHGGAGNIQRKGYPADKYDEYRHALLTIVRHFRSVPLAARKIPCHGFVLLAMMMSCCVVTLGVVCVSCVASPLR